MVVLPDGARRYSPKDLIAYLEGDFAAWCERFAAERERLPAAAGTLVGDLRPDEDPERGLAARKGTEHEARYFAEVRKNYDGLVEIARDDRATASTLAAMREAAPVIYQPRLEVGCWHGYPDFLFRVDGPSALGAYHYVAWDTKLARSARPYFLVQLCAYAELLEAIQGRRPAELVFVLGDGSKLSFRTDDYFYLHRQLKRSFLAFQEHWRPDAMPDPGLDRSHGQWSEAAALRLAARDHLSRVAGITRGQVRRLEDAEIATRRALAELDGRPVPRISPPVLDRLKRQARLQRDSAGAEHPAYELRPILPDEPRRGLALLPPSSDGDVFFDMEGFPFAEGGLEYLFGAVTLGADGPRFHDWWAHDRRGEKRAFEAFIDWVHDRWRADPRMHVYHYASYEKAAVCRLMGVHATREAQVDDLLRGGVFVDLYAVVRQGFIVGTPSYSLKDIEQLYRGARAGEVISGGGSVLEYQRWLDANEPRDWTESPILRGIRDYNRVDCDSTRQLRDWLLARQAESGIAYLAPVGKELPAEPAGDTDPAAEETVAARLLARVESGAEADPERARVTQLLAWLVDYHRREEKPMWWRMFERHAMTEEELASDFDCLAGLTRTATSQRQIKRSFAFEYRFDPEQDTRLREESKCFVAGDLDLEVEIVTMDLDTGLLELKVGPGKTLPDRLSLIPNEHVSAGLIKAAILRYAEAWETGRVLSRAVDDLLFRRPPRILEHAGGPLLLEDGDLTPQVVDLASRLDGTTLAIQGPPGTGKTFTAAAMIVALLRRGARLGVAANSHKVVLNLLGAVAEARTGSGAVGALYKVGDEADDELVQSGAVTLAESRAVATLLENGPCVVGGTAWVFSRPELQGRFDYLFIDEAGQVPLANAVAMGLSARNLILVGDQMQLGQPTRGAHPGESGLSCIEYVLHGHATVPPELGVFLGVSHRMHPSVCRFISVAIYDGRLSSVPATERHRVVRGAGAALIAAETGVLFVPVAHEGCAQSSEEEVEVIARIVAELRRRTVVGKEGGPRALTLGDILFVAPFNLQVRRLQERLGAGARVGSVDRFQGRQAPVVIVSLCASSLDEAPRGAEFLLSPNRLNVAVSRAQALAVVVGCPALLAGRCRSIEEMKLVNLLCRLEQYAQS
ncbi:MAG: TM0106 family RecB-like putative nuclease [Gemmatimonadales bacterium]